MRESLETTDVETRDFITVISKSAKVIKTKESKFNTLVLINASFLTFLTFIS